jgi:hypothetical protein
MAVATLAERAPAVGPILAIPLVVARMPATVLVVQLKLVIRMVATQLAAATLAEMVELAMVGTEPAELELVALAEPQMVALALAETLVMAATAATLATLNLAMRAAAMVAKLRQMPMQKASTR